MNLDLAGPLLAFLRPRSGLQVFERAQRDLNNCIN